MAMELDAPVALQQIPQTAATILCCNCGAPIDGTTSAGALCYDCIKLTVDISEGIQREATLHICRDCDRWLSVTSGKQWLVAAPESRELLALCLRKINGLSKVRVIDASFIWTEPHSRRVKVKITIQKEQFEGTILQQTFEVEYMVAYQQCPDCAKSYTHNTWRAVVQVRQHVPHKRTFLYLEQLMLKHSAHQDTINIKEVNDGIDFYFAQRNHAEKLVDFLTSVVPVHVKKSQELISMDIHTSTKSYKFSYSISLVPICKDDLVALPIKLAKQINISPLVFCYRVGTSVSFLDVNTLQTADVSPKQYWHSPFKPLADVQELVEFVVLDVEPIDSTKGRFLLAEATVARASDLGVNDTTYFTRTHLGGILHPGDSVMGYHLSGANFNNPLFEALESHKTYSSTIPDVVLVKKFYARKKKSKTRNWQLKRMAKEESEMLPRKQDQDRLEMELEMFMRDVEEDAELRNTLNGRLFKSSRSTKPERMEVEEQEGEEGSDEEALQIPLDQLVDELEDLTMHDE